MPRLGDMNVVERQALWFRLARPLYGDPEPPPAPPPLPVLTESELAKTIERLRVEVADLKMALYKHIKETKVQPQNNRGMGDKGGVDI